MRRSSATDEDSTCWRRLAATPDGIGTEEVSPILGLESSKGIGSRLRATRTEIESQGIRLKHAVVRTPRSRGPGSTWMAGPRIEHALHVLRRTRKRIEQPFDRRREPWPEKDYKGPVLVLRALLHAYELSPIPDGIDGAGGIVNDIEEPLVEEKPYRSLGEVFIERIELGDESSKIPIPPGYEQHGEWVRGHDDYGSIRAIASNWSTGGTTSRCASPKRHGKNVNSAPAATRKTVV